TGNFPLTIGGQTLTPPTTIPGATTHFSVTTTPTTSPAGRPNTFNVTAPAAATAETTHKGGTGRVSSREPATTPPAKVPLTNETGTFDVTFKSAGFQTLTAADSATASITGTSSSVNVGNVGAPSTTHFIVTGAPASFPTAGPNTFNITVTAADTSNTTQTG